MKSGHRAVGWAYVGSANLSESAWYAAQSSSHISAYVGLMIITTQGKTCPRQNDQDTKAELPQLGMWRGPSGSQRQVRPRQIVNKWTRLKCL